MAETATLSMMYGDIFAESGFGEERLVFLFELMLLRAHDAREIYTRGAYRIEQ
jgi:hypothetical protein